jgi:lipopolysaccharide biosynthesis protein
MTSRLARVIAFYLPQFYPTPENDAWWGPGFTEWTNVAQARQLFRSHLPAALPGELGFYDLRLAETRIAQAKLAAEHGVESFCYWHYWFGGGKRILNRPFDEVLASGQPDFPFCLCWANHSWSGIWRGLPNQILVEQTYPGEEDYKKHFDLVLPAFRDARYTRVDGKPLFLVYSPEHIPPNDNFLSLWRRLAEQAGLPGLHFVAMYNGESHPALTQYDGVTRFGPGDYVIRQSRFERLLCHDLGPVLNRLIGHSFGPARFSYRKVAQKSLDYVPTDDRYYPGVLSNWDNTPRSKRRGIVFTGSTPQLFGEWLSRAVQRVAHRSPEHRLVFLKAWNEWAEGNYVEPDITYGRGWLEAIKKCILE